MESLETLVKHGKEKRVRVAPGVGVNCYGGVYYEGEHEFSLEVLLRKHPEYAAVDESGNFMVDKKTHGRSAACPRNGGIM